MSSDDDSPPTSENINALFNQMSTTDESGHKDVIQKLQAIRLWQLMQQEELKKQQQTQLALLKSQRNSKLHDEDDEVLAVPICDLPSSPIVPTLEQSCPSQSEQKDQDDDSDKENNPLTERSDSILLKLSSHSDQSSHANIISEEELFQSDEEKEVARCEEQPDIPRNSHYFQKADVSKTHAEESLTDIHDNLQTEIETSFEKSSKNTAVFDEVPIQGGKTFDEILAAELKQEKERNAKKISSASTPKRTFLRKGQGIARFNGPPKKPKLKKKPLPKADVTSSTPDFPVTIKVAKKPLWEEVTEVVKEKPPLNELFGSDQFSEDTNETSDVEELTVLPKPRVRKTARLSRREPMKQLILVPETTKSSVSPEKIVLDDDAPEASDEINESTWSEVEDNTLLLDTTDRQTDLDKTSNETFEQMEQFCNEHYADLSSVKTLDDDDSVIMKKIKPLPPNKLMLSLFPSLRDDKKKQAKSVSTSLKQCSSSKLHENTSAIRFVGEPEKKQLSTISEADAIQVDPAQSTMLKNKLEEMEAEIKKFQKETEKLNSVRTQEEEQLQVLRQEFEEFQRQKEDELKRLEEFKKAETKKLKKDRKLFEEHVAGIKSLPNKQDRAYIQELESRISELQQESKQKEQRLSAVNNRLRSQVEVANDENEKLNKKVKALEEKLQKLERDKEVRKNKKSQVAWKAINDIVDSIPVNDENVNIDDYIETHTKPRPNIMKTPKSQPLPLRSPLSDRSDNQLNVSEVKIHEGKVERRKKDGTLEISFENGTQKYVFTDGTTQIKFTNGDVKTTLPDGKVNYHYTSSGTVHTTHPNGMQVIEFSNKQVERHFPDGSKHISFEDGSSKMIKLDGTEETIFPDGTLMVLAHNGDKTIEFSNGQREIHTSEFKRREYPDGTCKTVFTDGRQETKYASGRLRIKDRNGTLIVDQMVAT